MEGGLGPDTFKGGPGDDIIKGGKAGFDEMGVPGQDIAIYSKAESSYTIEFYNQKHEKKETYQSDGYMKVIDLTHPLLVKEVTFGELKVLNLLMVLLDLKKALIDLDGDGLPDVGSKSGTTGSDTLNGGEMDENVRWKG